MKSTQLYCLRRVRSGVRMFNAPKILSPVCKPPIMSPKADPFVSLIKSHSKMLFKTSRKKQKSMINFSPLVDVPNIHIPAPSCRSLIPIPSRRPNKSSRPCFRHLKLRQLNKKPSRMPHKTASEGKGPDLRKSIKLERRETSCDLNVTFGTVESSLGSVNVFNLDWIK